MAKQWFESDKFWATYGPAIFNPDILKSTPVQVDKILEWTAPEPGAHVLDLGCGVGRHSLELARRGYRVTGVDRTRLFLAEARKTAKAEKLRVELVRSDMREFVRPDTFHLAINLFTTFGYFADPADDRRVLEHVYTSLRPKGRVVLDTMCKEVLARIFQPKDWRRLADGSILLEERQVLDGWSRVWLNWTLVKDGQVHEHFFEHRLYAGSELAGLFASVGFRDVQVFGGFDGSPFDHQAKRLIVVATKPG